METVSCNSDEEAALGILDLKHHMRTPPDETGPDSEQTGPVEDLDEDGASLWCDSICRAPVCAHVLSDFRFLWTVCLRVVGL